MTGLQLTWEASFNMSICPLWICTLDNNLPNALNRNHAVNLDNTNNITSYSNFNSITVFCYVTVFPLLSKSESSVYTTLKLRYSTKFNPTLPFCPKHKAQEEKIPRNTGVIKQKTKIKYKNTTTSVMWKLIKDQFYIIWQLSDVYYKCN